jgi:hypothetical protein
MEGNTFLILETDLALTGFSGTDQFQSCALKTLGVFLSNGKLIIPFELTFNSVELQVTEIVGFAYSPPAPTDFDKSGNAAVGQTLDCAVTVSAQL